MRRYTFLVVGFAAFCSVATASAKIYPDDFRVDLLNQPMQASTDTAPPAYGGTGDSEEAAAAEDFFYVAPLPEGVLTRSDVLEALATRLYQARDHDKCFDDLVRSSVFSAGTVSYELLFPDVSIESPTASSVCVGLRTGIARGYRDGTFRPDQPMTVAEVAVLLARVSLNKSWLGVHGAPWYEPSMQAIREVDREFTMRPADRITGKQLQHLLCVLSTHAPLDPLGEFRNEC